MERRLRQLWRIIAPKLQHGIIKFFGCCFCLSYAEDEYYMHPRNSRDRRYPWDTAGLLYDPNEERYFDGYYRMQDEVEQYRSQHRLAYDDEPQTGLHYRFRVGAECRLYPISTVLMESTFPSSVGVMETTIPNADRGEHQNDHRNADRGEHRDGHRDGSPASDCNVKLSLRDLLEASETNSDTTLKSVFPPPGDDVDSTLSSLEDFLMVEIL
jgi:hypothetical protein